MGVSSRGLLDLDPIGVSSNELTGFLLGLIGASSKEDRDWVMRFLPLPPMGVSSKEVTPDIPLEGFSGVSSNEGVDFVMTLVDSRSLGWLVLGLLLDLINLPVLSCGSSSTSRERLRRGLC